MFLNQTPSRWFPIEQHTTLINYLPKQVAAPYARRFSKRNLEDSDWNTLLRKGIRGASEREVLKLLAKELPGPVSLRPSMNGLKDHVDLWYRNSSHVRQHPLKRPLYMGLKALHGLTGT